MRTPRAIVQHGMRVALLGSRVRVRRARQQVGVVPRADDPAREELVHLHTPAGDDTHGRELCIVPYCMPARPSERGTLTANPNGRPPTVKDIHTSAQSFKVPRGTCVRGATRAARIVLYPCCWSEA